MSGGHKVLSKLTVTEKVLMAAGAIVIAGAAAVGIATLIKKKKEQAGEIKELVIDSDEIEEEEDAQIEE